MSLRAAGALMIGGSAAIALSCPALGNAATTIATVTGPTTVSAYGDVVAWSSYVPRTRRFRLTAQIAGRIRTLPVRGRTVPFDVDLGPGAGGRVVAVYSRCRRDPDYALPAGSLPQPNYSRGVGCDIYRYDFSTRRESKVAAVSGKASSEYMPSIWRNRIAFARVYERRHGRAGVVTWVYTRLLSRHSRSKRVPAGPWGFFELGSGSQLPRGAGGAGVMGIDLAGRRLGLAWEYMPFSNLPGRSSGEARYNILLDTLGGGRQLIASLSTPEIIQNGLFGPSLSNGSLSYGEFQPDVYGPGPNSFIVRYSIAQRTLENAPLEGSPFTGMLVSQSTAQARTIAVHLTASKTFTINQYDDLVYGPGLPHVP